ncbi:hypothetical protein F503_07610 [Ophiostoma piceae UAMH 11346]|uniref:Uncharacterized protein n=1 Tax=Ophiostoma piceae (strain UAMH 11346) TaxID=1262450 RepID=S3C8K6_OPHP1|nr:hypothetical protein F503_07610 [Ophiostoma piceae UAMH 11346]
MSLLNDKVVLVDIAKFDTKLMQLAEGLFAAVDVLWLRRPRAFHPLSDEANNTPIFALSKMAQEFGTDTVATDQLLEKHGSATFDFGMR